VADASQSRHAILTFLAARPVKSIRNLSIGQ